VDHSHQEPKKEKDDEYVTKLNQYMNSPPEYSAPNAGGRGKPCMLARVPFGRAHRPRSLHPTFTPPARKIRKRIRSLVLTLVRRYNTAQFGTQ
jgi:hypothetical protein